jgi:hypothetical protein
MSMVKFLQNFTVLMHHLLYVFKFLLAACGVISAFTDILASCDNVTGKQDTFYDHFRLLVACT